LEATKNPLPTKRPRTTRRQWAVLVVVLLAIGVPLITIWAWNNSVCPTIPLVPSGTVLSIQPSHHFGYNFTVPKILTSVRALYMTLSSDNGVVLYVMTPSQYLWFNSNGVATSYSWTSGQVTSVEWYSGCKVCANGPMVSSVGQWYFVLSNPSPSLATKVSVSEQIEVGNC
jgi:hypothetical protein